MQWYTIETTWSNERIKTTKKQRFKYIQEVILCLFSICCIIFIACTTGS